MMAMTANRVSEVVVSAGILLGLMSCSGTETGVKFHSVKVSVSDEDGGTKAAGTDNNGEYTIHSVQIFVFNEDGTLDTEGYSEVKEGAFSMMLNVQEGKGKVFHAVVNRAEMKDITTEKSLLSGKTSLSENTIGSLIMTGHSVMDISSDCSVTIYVRRLVAKILLCGIEADLEDNRALNINSIFLTNVNSGITIDGCSPSRAQDWLNQRGYVPSGCDGILYEPCGIKLEDGGYDTAVHTFYCYPNPFTDDTHDDSGIFSERCTRLVIDTDAGFYHLDLKCADGIESNHTYLIENIVITHPGGDSPETEQEEVPLSFDLEICDWTYMEQYYETI